MTLPRDTSIYTLNDNLEDIKIYNNEGDFAISTIKYIDNLKGYITLENFNSQKYEMYFINSNGEKNLISNNTTKDNFKYFTVEYRNNLYYLTDDNVLYSFNAETNEQVEIESNVNLFNITNKGDLIIETTTDLYIIDSKNKKIVLSTDGKCEYYYTDKKNRIIYFEKI